MTLVVSVAAAPDSLRSAPAAQPPNVILMVLDDATVADLADMPNVQSLLVQQGTTFDRNYAPMPLCCPARATILTGLYPHNHHVLDNVAPYGGFGAFDDSNTIATYLDPVYDTQIIGKYLNDFENVEANNLTYQSPGWDDWRVAVIGVYNYVKQQIAVNGVLKQYSGYMPGVYGRFATRFIQRVPTTQPWFSYLAWVAPHKGVPHETPTDPPSPYVPLRLRGTYTKPALPDDPSINEADVSDKSTYVSSRPLLTSNEMAVITDMSQQRRESLEVVDDQIGNIVSAVTAEGELDNTYFILVSDNGYMQGQHRISHGKDWPYDPGARVPLIIRGPGFPAGGTYDRVTGLQDLTPTILDLTGQPLPAGAPEPDGVSLLKLVQGASTDRPQLIEIATTMKAQDGTSSRAAARQRPQRLQQLQATGPSWHVRGVVTSDGWKYFQWADGEEELYDLNSDPFELQNVAADQKDAGRLAVMQALLAQYQDCSGASCR